MYSLKISLIVVTPESPFNNFRWILLKRDKIWPFQNVSAIMKNNSSLSISIIMHWTHSPPFPQQYWSLLGTLRIIAHVQALYYCTYFSQNQSCLGGEEKRRLLYIICPYKRYWYEGWHCKRLLCKSNWEVWELLITVQYNKENWEVYLKRIVLNLNSLLFSIGYQSAFQTSLQIFFS